MDGIEFIKRNWKSYKDKKNVNWEIKWDSANGLFAFFLYLEEGKSIKVYRELIPNEVLKLAIVDKERINDIVETCMNKLSKLNGTDFKK